MKCLILRCGREAERWYRIDEPSGSYMTASCARCEKKTLKSVVGPKGSVVTRIGYDEFLVTEVMETMEVLMANVEVGNGRLLYVPISEDL
jgi:hypothetical protein